MSSTLLNCNYCNNSFYRRRGHVNEGKKFGWKTFCSQKCLALSRTQSTEFICSRPGCSRKFFRTLSDSVKSENFYCSVKCAAMVNNLSRTKKIRICPICSGEFTENRIYCSEKCIPKHKSKYTEQVVLDNIKDFYKNHSRIPVKREMYGVYKVARKFFGTWNKAVKAAGFKPNPVMFAMKYIANDGDKCDSLAEKIVDDFLYVRKIKHSRNFPYPGNKKFTVDFKVGDYWIEFFGLLKQLKRYDELVKKKLQLVEKHKLKLIGIYPEDLFTPNGLSNKLTFK